jgi:hypothetical protein
MSQLKITKACENKDIKYINSINNINPKFFYSGLKIATQKGNIDIVKCIIIKLSNKHLICANFINYINELFKIACYNGFIEIAKWYYTYIPINQITRNDGLLQACQSNKCNNIELVKWLIIINANINYKDGECFIWACRAGNLEIAKLLYSYGCNINSTDDFDNTAFIAACQLDNSEVAKWLYSLGADIHYKQDEAFNRARYYGRFEIIKWMCDIDNYVDTLLNSYVSNSFVFIEIEILKLYGYKINKLISYIDHQKDIYHIINTYFIGDLSKDIIKYYIIT